MRSYCETGSRLLATISACSRSIDSARLEIAVPNAISKWRFKACIAMNVGSACISMRSSRLRASLLSSTGGSGTITAAGSPAADRARTVLPPSWSWRSEAATRDLARRA
jgi:hypothetical protein